MNYQFIIIGGGCAGLQLAKSMLSLSKDMVTSILLIESKVDHEEKSWCFWHDENHTYSHLVKKKWTNLGFNADQLSKVQNTYPQTYQYINSKDFYDFHLDFFEKDNRIAIAYEKVEDISTIDSGAIVQCTHHSYTSDYVFYSHPAMMKEKYYQPKIWQHFLGWNIMTTENVFDVSKAIMMDFDLGACSDIRFIYVLPFTDKSALIECTIFSSEIYDTENYEETIKNYIAKNYTLNYTIKSKEVGKIPMDLTESKFDSFNRIIPIGTAAGCIKPSTGYSFKRNMDHSDSIINFIRRNKEINPSFIKRKYRFYDALFLQIVQKRPGLLKNILTQLFKHNSILAVLDFLDEKTTLWQDIKIFMYLPKWPFIRAIFKQ